MGAAERIEWWGEHPALLWSLHPCVTGDDVWDNVEPANDNAQGLILVVRHNVPQVGMFFPHARERLERKRKETSPRQGEAQLAQAHRAEQAGGWGLTNYRFTGKEEDVEVGLQYFGFRYLNPVLGRWISPDPLEVHSLGESGELNVYAYVSGTVLKSTDPLGLADGAEGQSGAGAGDGNQADSGADSQAKAEQQQAPQQQAFQDAERAAKEEAARAESKAREDALRAGFEAGANAYREHAGAENSSAQMEAAKEAARSACGANCDKHKQVFENAFASSASVAELTDKLTKNIALLSALGGSRSVGPSVGSLNLKSVPKPAPKGATATANASSKPAAEQATSSRAARRQAMRDAGIPTSQQPVSSARNASGRSFEHNVGGKQMSVQQQTMDRSHPGQGHWEAGPVKTDPVTQQPRMNSHGRPKLTNEKSKVDYGE